MIGVYASLVALAYASTGDELVYSHITTYDANNDYASDMVEVDLLSGELAAGMQLDMDLLRDSEGRKYMVAYDFHHAVPGAGFTVAVSLTRYTPEFEASTQSDTSDTGAPANYSSGSEQPDTAIDTGGGALETVPEGEVEEELYDWLDSADEDDTRRISALLRERLSFIAPTAPLALASLDPVAYLEAVEVRTIAIEEHRTDIETRQTLLRNELEAAGASLDPVGWLGNTIAGAMTPAALELLMASGSVLHVHDLGGETSDSDGVEIADATQVRQFWAQGYRGQIPYAVPSPVFVGVSDFQLDAGHPAFLGATSPRLFTLRDFGSGFTVAPLAPFDPRQARHSTAQTLSRSSPLT